MAFKVLRGQQLVIDLGSYSTKFILGTSTPEQITINKAFSMKTPEGSYSNGRIEDPEALSVAIKNVLSENGIKLKKATITFSSTEMIQREMTVPKLSYEDTVGLVRYDISQYLPIEIDEYDVTYVIKSSILEEGVEKYNILVYLVKKVMVDGIYNLIKSSGLTPASLDAHSNAVSKFIDFFQEHGTDVLEKPETIAVVDLGYMSMLVNIVSNGMVALNRTVGSGYYAQDHMISKRLSMTMEEAENFRIEKLSKDIGELRELYDVIKHVDFDDTVIKNEDLGLGEGQMTSDEKQLFEILRDCMRQYDSMGEELTNVLQYYLSRNDKNHVDKVLFHGTSADSANLVEYLNSILEYESSAIEFDKIKSIVFPENMEHKLSYVNAIGALLTRQEA